MPKRRKGAVEQLPPRAKRSGMSPRRRPSPVDESIVTHDPGPITVPPDGERREVVIPHAKPNAVPRQKPNEER